MSAASASAAAPGYTVSSLPIVTGTTNPSQIPEAAFIDDIEAFVKANGTTVETLLQELQTLHQYVGIASRPPPPPWPLLRLPCPARRKYRFMQENVVVRAMI